jgi:hypothetical protein
MGTKHWLSRDLCKIEAKINGVPKGVRTPVLAVKGRCPRPLDDGDRTIYFIKTVGGAKGDRTPDLLHAMQALSQLSYGPVSKASHFTVFR